MQITSVKRVSADVIWVEYDKTIATGCALGNALLFYTRTALVEIIAVNKKKNREDSRYYQLLRILLSTATNVKHSYEREY